MKRIECSQCLGMGKRLVKKSGVVKMVACKPCKGKGKILVETGSKASKTSKITSAKVSKVKVTKKPVRKPRDEDEDEDEAPRPVSGKLRSTSRDLETGQDVTSKLSPDQILAKETIEDRAGFFGCPGKVIAVRKGPVITLYEFQPAKTTRVKRLINLQEDLALGLSAEAVMVRRIPGRDVMGIEISNESSERQNVAFRASLAAVQAAKKNGMELPLNLGTDPFGDPIVDDLAAMPHLLIAGTTGSGKSVSLNCIISSMLTVCPPEELEFYMIDPKGVELVHYDGIPHMKEKMVTSPHYAKDMLERLVIEMRRRLTLLKSKLVRDIKEYNAIMVKNGTPRMPRIVAVIDEFGDLMMHDRKAFTHLVAEISQIARATGIHMIVATQRPSVDVISGRIKVNFPGRMAFKVTSQTDSKVILQRKGAESLLGMGDMLYLSPTRSTLTRIHAPWVPLTDVKAVADKLREIESKRLEEERKKRMAEEEQRRRELAARHTPTQSPSFVPPKTLNRGEEETMEIDFNWATPKKA